MNMDICFPNHQLTFLKHVRNVKQLNVKYKSSIIYRILYCHTFLYILNICNFGTINGYFSSWSQ